MKLNILGIITIAFISFMTQTLQAQEMKHRDKNNNNCHMFQNLNLTEAQQDQINTLRLNHKMEMIDLKANLQKKDLGLDELKNEGSYTREEYLNQIEAINSAKNEIVISRANFQMNVYQLLDENQKKEWNKFSQFCDDRLEKRIMRKIRETKID